MLCLGMTMIVAARPASPETLVCVRVCRRMADETALLASYKCNVKYSTQVLDILFLSLSLFMYIVEPLYSESQHNGRVHSLK